MIRFVVGPDRQLVPDLAAKLPGRGLWLSADADVLEFGEIAAVPGESDPAGSATIPSRGSARAGKPNEALADRRLARAFSRSARGPVTVPPDLAPLLQGILIRRIGELLGLARRAGQALAGFEKAREALRTGPVRLVLQASDGSPTERARFLTGVAAEVMIFDPLPAETLGRIFGRDHVVHVVVLPGRLADALAVEAGRLSGLRKRSERTMGSHRTTGRDIASANTKSGATDKA